MKNLKFLFIISLATFLLSGLIFYSCSKNDQIDSKSTKKNVHLQARSQSLNDILTNGVQSSDDFDVLRNANEYPFDRIRPRKCILP